MPSNARMMVIGWDSAPPALVFEQYRDVMPNLDRLMRQGVWGPLRSTDPPITVPAWTSMLSSCNPGRLGFYGFRNRRVGEYEGKWIATGRSVKVNRVWDILSRRGKRCCVLNVPQTFPVRPLNGAMVSCFLTPDTNSDYTYPRALKADVERVADGYMIDVENFRTDDKQWLLEQIHLMTEKRYRVARYLLGEQGPWDLFMMVYMGPDRLQHGFWKYADPQHRKHEAGTGLESCLRDFYALLDRQLGELCELAGPDATVMVVSDHGAKRMDGSFQLNDWLIREGFLTLKQSPDGPTKFAEANVDWSRTTAWAWGGYYARIFLNVAGREPEGIVTSGEYESVREDLIRRLAAVLDDRGRVMDTRVLRPQELFTGPHVDDAPDLFVYFDDLYWRAGQDVGYDALYSFDTEIGPDDCNHDYHGVFALARPEDQRGQRVQGLQLMDVAPTILHELGVEIPAEMEGNRVE
jgi:predicted AlkP superfamily phosphohydrolase/phosphomutase